MFKIWNLIEEVYVQDKTSQAIWIYFKSERRECLIVFVCHKHLRNEKNVCIEDFKMREIFDYVEVKGGA